MDKKDLINKFKKVLDTKKCKSSQDPVPALICRNKEKKVRKDSTWKKEEIKMLEDAIAEIEKNELEDYLRRKKRSYHKKVRQLEEGNSGAAVAYRYLRLSSKVFELPAIIHYITKQMINKEYIKKYSNPLQRYDAIILEDNILREWNVLPIKLNILRLTLSHYKRSSGKPTLDTIL
jgi:hypothetical protein